MLESAMPKGVTYGREEARRLDGTVCRCTNEQDSKKLMKLIEQINRLLLEKEARLKSDDSGAGNAKRIAWGQLIIGKGTDDGR
jgi:hypothetical protein